MHHHHGRRGRCSDFFTYYPLTQSEFLEAMEELCDTIAKPLFIVPGYATRAGEGLIQAVQHGLPALPTPERAARGIWALRQYARFLERQGTS